MKEKVHMREWEVNIVHGEYNLSGRAEYHYRLGRNVHIAMSSTLEKYEITNEELIYETLNTIYICPLKYMNIYPYEDIYLDGDIKKLKNQVKDGKEAMDELILAAIHIICKETHKSKLAQHISKLQKGGYEEIQAEKQKEKEEMYELLSQYENCIYMQANNVEYGSPLAYHMNGEYGIMEPSFHCGTFQDSVLYLNFNDEGKLVFEFRYFPKWWGSEMKTYAWSSNIEKVIIRNDTAGTLTFNKEEINVGEIKIFERCSNV